jgi:hypothetical protein
MIEITTMWDNQKEIPFIFSLSHSVCLLAKAATEAAENLYGIARAIQPLNVFMKEATERK